VRVLGLDLGRLGAATVIVPNARLGAVLHWRRLKGLDADEWLDAVGHLIETFEVEVVACERPFVGGHARITASQRAKFTAVEIACKRAGVKLVTYAPSEVKKALCGNGRASKEQMQRAVRSLLRFDAPDEHVADAAAIGTVALSREGR
jgi:crossover junction endodeoxyribonuclease RuvC